MSTKLVDKVAVSLSTLIIDADKDWLGFKIKNLGAPVDGGDALRLADFLLSKLNIDAGRDWKGKAIYNVVLQGVLLGDYASTTLLDDDGDHKLGDVIPPPPAVPGPKLLYPDITMSLVNTAYTWAYYNDGGYLGVKYTGVPSGGPYLAHCTDQSFGDKVFRCRFSCVEVGANVARLLDSNNYYHLPRIWQNAATQDHQIRKIVAGTDTLLAYEAVDLSAGTFDCVGSAIGTALKSSRDGGATFPLSVTDTSFSSGRWGFYCYNANSFHRPVSFGSPPPPPPKCIGYYELPIIGGGSPDNPFRAALPELVEVPSTAELDGYPPELVSAIKANKGGAVNRLALTHSALIPTDPATGKPLNATCIVRLFEQPVRQPHLHSLTEAISKLETTAGVRKLDVAQAVKRALEMDKKLKESDLGEWT